VDVDVNDDDFEKLKDSNIVKVGLLLFPEKNCHEVNGLKVDDG